MTITPAQQSFITSLLSERLVTLGFTTISEVSTALNLENLSKQDASTLIGRLKGMPRDPDNAMPEVVAKSTRNGKGNRIGPCAGCGHTVQPDTGFYYLTPEGRWNVHHKVGDCNTATPAPARVDVTEGVYVTGDRIILVYKTQNKRLAGKVWTGHSFVYRPGAVQEAGLGRRITAEEAAVFGKTHGTCVACARPLNDQRSTDVGYGPVCAKRYGWPWGAKVTA